MKKTAFILLILILQACVDEKRQLDTLLKPSIEVSEDIQNLTKDEVATKSVSVRIPSYDFETFQNEVLKNNNDTTYVVNFWATWCKPCIKELPAFEKVTSKYSDKKVKVLLVSLDFPDKIESQVIPFLKKNNIQSEVVLLDDANANSWIPKISPEWSGAIPATVIYRNNTRKFYEQSFNFEDLETELKTFL